MMKEDSGSGVPMILGDAVRLAVDVFVHGLSLLAAAAVFSLLWFRESAWLKVAAFPAAYAAMVAAFGVLVLLLCAVIPKPRPGRYRLQGPEAVPWIVGESMVLMVSRSFLGGYIRDFSLPRYLYLRLLGAKVCLNTVVGGDALILDPWVLRAGPNVTIGSRSIIAGHTIEGGTLTVGQVTIARNATVGMHAILLPGAEIGPGSIVAAGAVLSKDCRIEAGEIWGGIPARRIRSVRAD